jgi:ribonuclease HI
LKVIVNVDGLCEPVNPGGTATYGFVIRNESDDIIAKKYGVVGKGPRMSNNVAEYAALCEALRFLENSQMTQSLIEVRSDSRLLVNQMSGEWKFHKGLYEQKYLEAKELVKNFGKISFKWVPREKNEEADALSREAYSIDRSDA